MSAVHDHAGLGLPRTLLGHAEYNAEEDNTVIHFIRWARYNQ